MYLIILLVFIGYVELSARNMYIARQSMECNSRQRARIFR